MKTLRTFDDVLSLWDGPKALSEDLDVPYVNAQSMKNRKSVGVDHWPKLIKLLTGKGYSVTTDDLVRMRIRSRSRDGARPKKMAANPKVAAGAI